TGRGGPLGRRGSDNVTVLQTGTANGTGSSVSLRWENTVGAAVASQHLRVSSAGCGAACGTDDRYRGRVYETTYTIPRLNNASRQPSVVFVQNPTSQPVAGHLYFWDPGGRLLHTQPFSVAPKGTYLLTAPGVGARQGKSGSITVAHDARYGTLAGKAVSV